MADEICVNPVLKKLLRGFYSNLLFQKTGYYSEFSTPGKEYALKLPRLF
jgi:hypothetical protein